MIMKVIGKCSEMLICRGFDYDVIGYRDVSKSSFVYDRVMFGKRSVLVLVFVV